MFLVLSVPPPICPVSHLFDVSSQIFRVSRIRSFSSSLVVSQLCRARVEIGDSWNKNMYIERASQLCFLLSHLSDQLHNLTYSLMKFSLDLLTMASDFAFWESCKKGLKGLHSPYLIASGRNCQYYSSTKKSKLKSLKSGRIGKQTKRKQ